VKLITETLAGLGLTKDAVKTTLANKTTVVTHLATVQPDQLAGALNSKLLGARIVQSGGADGSEKEATPWTLKRLQSDLVDTGSTLCRILLIVQSVAFIGGVLSNYFLPEYGIGFPMFWLVVALGHALARRAVMGALALRISIHVLMFTVLVGALCLNQLREAATVSLLVSGSEWLLGWVNNKVQEAMSKNLIGSATHATKISKDGAQAVVAIADLVPGDTVLVKSGEVIPVDGKITKISKLKIDEASVTGEAMPVEKAKDSLVSSGTVVVSGVGEIECTATVENSFQGRMRKAVDDAKNSQSRTAEIVDQIAAWYTPCVVVVSLVVAFYTANVERGLATLVAACPCALVAAAPVPQSCTLTSLLTHLQVLVKNAGALENLGKMTTLAVDKTGTLTQGNFELTDSVMLSGAGDIPKDELLRKLAAIEANDPHPLANCLVSAYVGCVASYQAGGSTSTTLPRVTKFTRVESAGVYGLIDSQMVGAGSATFLDAMAIDLPDEAEAILKAWESTGDSFTVVYMTLEEDVAMILRLEDTVRPDACEAVNMLRGVGVEAALLTGDVQRPAESVAKAVGITTICSSLKPWHKEEWVRTRQHGAQEPKENADVLEAGLQKPLLAGSGDSTKRSREVVGMLGDGLNDGPALAAADVGIAISAGLQLTVDAADIVVNQGDTMLTSLAEAVAVAQSCHSLVLQNLVLAGCMKGAAIILAATGHLGLGSGVLSDTGAFLVVLSNGLRPLRWKVGQQQAEE